MARFAEIRKHQKGAKRRAAKEAAQSSNAARPASQATPAKRIQGAIKPTTQRIRGRHLRSYELDPETCDPRELAFLAEEALDDLATDNYEVAA